MSKIRAVIHHPGVRQLIKFCIVGASSTVVDKGLLWLLTKHFGVLEKMPYVPWWSWVTLTFCIAVTNGFIWNQRWTFRARQDGQSHRQFVKFLATNCVGLMLNLLITKMFLIYLTGQIAHGKNPDANTVIIASILAIPFVVIWNFSASKYWTFKTGDPQEDNANDVEEDGAAPNSSSADSSQVYP